MSLLRIHADLGEPPRHCQWSLIDDSGQHQSGEGLLADLPRAAGRVQLLLPAAQVLLLRLGIPVAARRNAGSTLAFAVEEQSACEPEQNQAFWLGSQGDDDAVAVVDKAGLLRWQQALADAGLGRHEVHCETLLLPWGLDTWSLAWNGEEGFLRSGEFEGGATDRGNRQQPPLSLQLRIEQSRQDAGPPGAILLHAPEPAALPDLAAWSAALGVDVVAAATWSWQGADAGSPGGLVRPARSWPAFDGLAARLRPAAWLLGAAMALHLGALLLDWTLLATEQRTLRRDMEAHFRATFPDAVAVADPALQMRRKLAEARHAAGVPDAGDFLPMLEAVAAAASELPAGMLRELSFDQGRIGLALAAGDAAAQARFIARLQAAGLGVDLAAGPATGAALQLTVRSP